MTLYSVAGAVGKGGFNVLVNAGAAYSASRIVAEHYISRDMGIIVAIDTVFRIAITHGLDALKIPYLGKGEAGHLLFPCLTLLTQPLSTKIAQRYFKAYPHWTNDLNALFLFGAIALGWKANMMVKDVMYLTNLLKP